MINALNLLLLSVILNLWLESILATRILLERNEIPITIDAFKKRKDVSMHKAGKDIFPYATLLGILRRLDELDIAVFRALMQ